MANVFDAAKYILAQTGELSPMKKNKKISIFTLQKYNSFCIYRQSG